MVMPYHLHMPSYFLETFTEYPHDTLFQIVIRFALLKYFLLKHVLHSSF